jgi:hypothetical protein
VYRELAVNEHVSWSWVGTKHALAYGHYRYDDAKPILEVLTLLEQQVTTGTRAHLATLLVASQQSRAK